jgi:hypothetical protein
LCIGAYAQTDTLTWQWNKKLTWDDFKAEPSAYKSLSHNMSMRYSYRDLSGSDEYLNPRINVLVYMERNISWANDSWKTTENLLKLQNRFDLFELGARKARFFLDSVVASGGSYYYSDAEDYIELAFDWYDRMTDKMYADYNNSRRTGQVAKWERKIDSLFRVYKEYNRYIKAPKGKVGFEFYLDGGPAFWLNRNDQLVQNSAAFAGSVFSGLKIKRSTLGLKFFVANNMAYPELKHRLNFELDEPNQLSTTEIHLYWSRRLIEGNRMSFSTLLMGGSSSVGSINYATTRALGYGAGVVFDFHAFDKSKPDVPYMELNLRLKLEYSRANFTYFYNQELFIITLGIGSHGYSTRYNRANTPMRFR